MNRKKGYIFTNKDHPKKGIMSTILGIISIGTLAAIVYLAYRDKGAVPDRYAATVFLVMIFSFGGIILGILGVTERDRYKAFPVLGLFLNILSMAAISLIMYAGAYGT